MLIKDIMYLSPVENLLGDVNGDGYINITDVSITVDYVLNHNTEFIILENADMNDDGDINITDISLIVSTVLGQQ